MLERLRKPRLVSPLHLVLLLAATAWLTHAVTTTPWKQLVGAKDDAFRDMWTEFCAELARAGDSVELYAPDDDDLDRAEGYRFLTRMLRLGLLVELEHADPTRPIVWESETATRKFGGNNPDELYYEAAIDGRRSYLLRGQRGTTPLIEITVYDGRIGSDPESNAVGHLTEADLVVDTEGRFEVALGPDPRPGNWIRTTPDARVLFIRQYRFDWARDEPAQLEIVPLDTPQPAPPSLRMEALRGALRRTAAFVRGNAELWPRYSAMAPLVARNDFITAMTPGSESNRDDTQMPQGHTLQPGAFAVEADEALLIEFTPPPGLAYWGFSLLNRWYESLDYRYAPVHTNHLRAEADATGRVRLVVAHSDPGIGNWISTTGHRRGTMLFRWTRPPEQTKYPEVETRLVKLSELRSAATAQKGK